MSNKTPPSIARKFFMWYCQDRLKEAILGDLEEQFEEDINDFGLNKARRRFTWNVLRFLRPGIIRSFEGTRQLNSYGMVKHNIILTLRNFRRQKSTFLINLIGLSTGLACVLFIYLWVNDELSMDAFHTNDNRLYQVQTNHHDASGINTWRGVPGLLYDEVKASVPEVEMAVAATDVHEYTLSADQASFKVNGRFASEEFFDVFSFELIHGDGKVLNDPSSIIISQSLAKRLFKSADADVIGQSINFHFWGRTKPTKVAGILKNLPKTTSENFDFIMSWEYYHDELISYKQWGNYYARIMLVVNENVDPKVAEAKIDKILKDHQERDNVDVILSKYSDLYLYNNYENGEQAGGRIEYVKLFSIVAIFILFIACVNFINLSTAKASLRGKEIGVKKSLGATRSSLMSQFFTESILLSFFSLIIAIGIVILFLPQFNFLTQKSLSIGWDASFFSMLGTILLIVGILAGCYPAIYLSGQRILSVMKSKSDGSTKHAWGRKGLVIMQFMISTILIAGSILIQRQMGFIQNKNLGYDRDNVVYFEREGKILENHDTFLAELEILPYVKKVTTSGFMVGGANSTGGISWEGKTDKDQIQFWETQSGYGLIEMLDIEVIEGRSFSKEFGSDSASIIFNETAIAAMGMENPIGKTVKHYTGNKKIIGVVKDFNIRSVHSKIEPSLFLFNPKQTHFIMAKLEQGKELEAMNQMESLYKSFNPGFPFNPLFLDQDYQKLYAAEQKVSILSKYFAILAVLISCLGLFGLAAFTTERRVKEIGIRKVLGSSVKDLIFLLTKDFTKLVLIAILIAIPISYYLGGQWLESFAYSINLNLWIFVAVGLGGLLIAWITVGLQTLKAARANPVESLKDE